MLQLLCSLVAEEGEAAGVSQPGAVHTELTGNKCCLCVTEVANVTTAVDIYSFGMCALEVSIGHRLWDRDDESEGGESSGKAVAMGW